MSKDSALKNIISNVMAFTGFLTAILLACIVWLYVSRLPRGFPPSPWLSLPLIGHAYLLGTNADRGFSRLRSRLGNIFGLSFGPNPMVVVSDLPSLQEAMSKDGLLDRPGVFSGARKSNLPDGSAPGNKLSPPIKIV